MRDVGHPRVYAGANFRAVTKVMRVLAGGGGTGLYSVGLAEIGFAATKVRAGDLTLRGELVGTQIGGQQKRSNFYGNDCN